MYPSDAIPPRLYRVIKARKPEKNYPMRTIVSTIETTPYGTSKYLVEIIQPTLSKTKHRVMNSASFVNEAATWETTQEDIQVSYDVINLYPSIPIDKAIIVLIDTLNNDLDYLNTRTKLTLTDIHKLTELCLSQSYFLYENKIRLLENAGPIGLSLMVVLSESYLQHLERKAIAEALTIQIQPKTFKRYVGDSPARFPSKHQPNTFQEILNKQDPTIQYIIEYENGNKSLNFLDINITKTINSKYEFKVHRRKAITNIYIKPTSCIEPNTIKSVFKGFLHRAHSICIKEREKFLMDIFLENGHTKQLWKNLVVGHSNKKNNKNNHENSTQNRDYTNLKKLPWIPNISPKIKREFKKIGKDIAFMLGKSLQQILCQKNKPKLLPNSQPRVYLTIRLLMQWEYIAESKKRVLTRCIEHQQDSMSGK